MSSTPRRHQVRRFLTAGLVGLVVAAQGALPGASAAADVPATPTESVLPDLVASDGTGSGSSAPEGIPSVPAVVPEPGSAADPAAVPVEEIAVGEQRDVAPAAALMAAAPAAVEGTTVFLETFQNAAAGATDGVNRYSSFVGVDGHVYTGSADWINGNWCNGLIVSAQNATQPSWASGADKCVTSGSVQSFNNLRLLADRLGQAFPPPSGTAAGNYVVSSWSECANNGANHSGSACGTVLGSGATNGRMFDTGSDPLTVTPGRYYTAAVDIAATSCTLTTHPQFRFQALTTAGGTAGPVDLGAAMNPCTAVTGPGVQTVNYANTPWPYGGNVGAKSIRVSRMTALGSFFATGPDLGLRLFNGQGATNGNDSAFDNVRLLDVTPTLHKEFGPTPIAAGGTSTLTFTIVNTAERAAKADFSFTDVMPTQVKVAAGALGGTCAQVSGAPFVRTAPVGGSTITVTGADLATGQASCTITVPVTSSVVGTHVNAASNLTALVGLEPPTAAELQVTGTLTLRKQLTRTVAGNQFTLAVLQGTTTLGTATTSGATNGLQAAQAVVPAAAGTTYTLREWGVGSPASVLTNYTTSLRCVDTATGNVVATTPVSATAQEVNNTMAYPAGVAAVECTYTNGPLQPAFTLEKTVSPTGTVAPGGLLTYTVVVRNSGRVPYTTAQPAAFSDDLGDVLDSGTMVTGSITTTAGSAQLQGTTLAWTGPLTMAPAAGSSVTVTYQVRANTALTGDLDLLNEVYPDLDSGSCAPGRTCRTLTRVFTPQATVGCTSDVFYSMDNAGRVWAVSVGNGITPTGRMVTVMPSAIGSLANALAQTPDGRLFGVEYYTQPDGLAMRALWRYTTAGGWVKLLTESNAAASDPTAGYSLIAGAWDEANQLYIYGTAARAWAYSPVTGQSRGIGEWSTVGTGLNGDYAVDAAGNLIVVRSASGNGTVITVPAAEIARGLAIGSSATPLTPSAVGQLSTVPGATFNGLALNAKSTMYVQSNGANDVTVIQEVDPNTLATIGTPTTMSFLIGHDLASCAMPSTLALRKDVVGRVVPTDQFQIEITRQDQPATSLAVMTTTGTTTGVQPAAGPIPARGGQVYLLTERPTAGADLARYETTLTCTTAGGTVLTPTLVSAPGAALRQYSLLMPTAPATAVVGTAVTCTYRNTPPPGVLTASKSSDPASGTALTPGATATVTLTFANSGALPVAVHHDDVLTDVLDDATVSTPTSSHPDLTVTMPTPDRMVVEGTVPPYSTSTVTYTVTVADPLGAGNRVLNNYLVPHGAAPPTSCPTTGAGSTLCTTHPLPRWTMDKVAAVDGVTVADGAVVRPGQVITYTVTATALQGTLTSLVLSDDLSGVLGAADFGTATLSVAGGPAVPVTRSGSASDQLRVTVPMLTAPQTAVLTYTVTVRPEAWSATVRNVVTGTGSVPPDRCVTGCSTVQVTPAALLIQKLVDGIAGPSPVGGAAFVLLADDAGAPGAPLADPAVVPAAALGTFSVSGILPGSYWLRETRAPSGANLLAQDVRFTVAADGSVTVAAGHPQVTVADVEGSVTIRVLDTTPFALPLSGGSGAGPLYLAGAALLVAAVLLLWRERRRRPMVGRA